MAGGTEAAGSRRPRGVLKLRALTMPGDLNSGGTIFGGWTMARLDQAAGMAAAACSQGPATTVAVRELTLSRPLRAGQEVEIYADLLRTGRTSMQFALELWAAETGHADAVLCAEAMFVMVALDGSGAPRQICAA